MNVAKTVLDQTFTFRDLFRRRCLAAWLWSTLAAACLFLLLVAGGLFVGILADRGRLSTNLQQSELELFRTRTGLPAGTQPDDVPGGEELAKPENNAPADATAQPEAAAEPVEGAEPVEPAVLPTVHVSYDEHGILPSVWRARNTWWGPSLAWLFRNVELLQSNVLSAMTLLACAVILWTTRAWSLSQARTQAQRSALEAVAPLRRNVHRQALRLGAEDLDGSGLGAAIELFNHDIETVRRNLARWIELDIRYPLELACLALIALSIQPLVSAQYLLFLGVAWYFLESRGRRAEAELHLATDHADEELRRLAASFQSARLVRGLGIEQVDHDFFAVHLVKFHELAARQSRAAEHAQHLRLRDTAACAAVAAFLLFILATHILLDHGGLSIAGGLVFIAAWALALPGARALRSRSNLLHQAVTAAEKIHTFLDRIPTVSQAVGARFLQPLTRTLHFDSVTYRMPSGRVLLNELDLTLEAGRTYSLVSLDPLESSALVAMLPRFIEPQKGRILFDGEDIAWATLESLRAETVFVGADDPLLPGTVLENIRGGRTEYTLQQAMEAAKLTHAHNFIVKLFDGYESDLPERSDLMDLSQRYRLGLARAMIRNPALLIIQEPSAHLDEDVKALLADAYDRICRDRTVIFLPCRMSTIRRSDQVIVLNEGRIAAVGPQSRLVSASPIYRHWEYLNFNEFRHQDN